MSSGCKQTQAGSSSGAGSQTGLPEEPPRSAPRRAQHRRACRAPARRSGAGEPPRPPTCAPSGGTSSSACCAAFTRSSFSSISLSLPTVRETAVAGGRGVPVSGMCRRPRHAARDPEHARRRRRCRSPPQSLTPLPHPRCLTRQLLLQCLAVVADVHQRHAAGQGAAGGGLGRRGRQLAIPLRHNEVGVPQKEYWQRGPACPLLLAAALLLLATNPQQSSPARRQPPRAWAHPPGTARQSGGLRPGARRAARRRRRQRAPPPAHPSPAAGS